MAGIQQTQELLDAVVALANAGGRIFEDGKFELSEIAELVSPLIKLPTALAGIGEVPVELQDLDQAESDQLIQFVKDNLDLPDDKAELAVVDALKIGASIYQFVKAYVLQK